MNLHSQMWWLALFLYVRHAPAFTNVHAWVCWTVQVHVCSVHAHLCMHACMHNHACMQTLEWRRHCPCMHTYAVRPHEPIPGCIMELYSILYDFQTTWQIYRKWRHMLNMMTTCCYSLRTLTHASNIRTVSWKMNRWTSGYICTHISLSI